MENSLLNNTFMDSTQTLISLGHAFRHCTSTGSYWLWIVLALVFSIACLLIIFRMERKTEVNPMVKIGLAFLSIAFIMGSIFIRPCTIAQNTSEKMAAEGHYIGY